MVILGGAMLLPMAADPVKWMLCWEMIVGRLEIIPVYVLLVPQFWR